MKKLKSKAKEERVKKVSGKVSKPVKSVSAKSGKVKAKVAPAKTKKPAAKVAKPLPTYTPVKEKFKITGLIEELAERAEVSKADAKAVIGALQDLILGSAVKKGVGEFMFPGLFKMVTIKKPAVKGGKKAINPFTKEPMITKDKPATVKVKIRPMKKLKDAALV